MISFVMIGLSVIGGALLTIQASVNSRLSLDQGPLRATFITFLVGTIFSAVLVVFLEPSHTTSILDVPKWQLTGSLLGLVYVLTMTFAVRVLGTATATIAVIFGQLIMSIFIDTFGWLGNPPIALSSTRIASVALLGAALWFIYDGNRGSVASSREKRK